MNKQLYKASFIKPMRTLHRLLKLQQRCKQAKFLGLLTADNE
jgi:hypothetical protein